jgi:tripeptidyl-peptidase-1
LLDVSTPDHPSYGKHLEGHEIKAMLAPTKKASSSVVSWLQDHNVTAIEEDGYWVTFATRVGTANKLLDTEFAWFKSDYRNQERLRTLEYSVPETIAEHINFVQPTIR